MEKHIAGLLAANKFDFAMARALPDSLDDTQLLVFNNVNFEAMKPEDKQRIEKFVQSGGGALWIAGENNMYVDHKGLPEDAIERTFPAKLAPPREPEDTVVVLIMDKSASMEGKKIELSRAAATGVVENLRPEDEVGILIFDNSFQWTVPIRRADDKPSVEAPDRRHQPGWRYPDSGGTDRGIPQDPASASDLQTHGAADRRYLRRGRQHEAG